jgi:class 3 adenylate cyclase/pimeloyl-ACP methyl ester carboxylesterase
MGELQYAQAPDGTHVAFRVLEADEAVVNPRDIVMLSGGLIPMEVFEDDPGFRRMLDGLRALGRVVIFDRRGLGVSDPIINWDRPVVEQWAEDLETVVVASDAQNAAVFAWDGFGAGTRFAAARPDLLQLLILMNPVVKEGEDDEFVATLFSSARDNLEGRRVDFLELITPSRANDPAFREWYTRAGQVGASPATAARIWNSVFSMPHATQRLQDVTTRTVVLYRRDNQYIPQDRVKHAASYIPGAMLVELDGADFFPFVGDVDSVVAEIAAFVLGERRLPAPARLLAAIMFTDIVGSTERAAAVGDSHWRSMLERHDKTLRTVVGRNGGQVVKTTGDGVLALLPSASAAVRAARQARHEMASFGLELRVGIHVGDVDRRGDDVSGLAVHIAARVMASADGQITVTGPVVGAVAGDMTVFDPAGTHELKGVPGTWDLYALKE